MKLVHAAEAHLAQLMRWFPDQRSCAVWGGPEFRYPFTDQSFREDIRCNLPSYALIGNNQELLGFGQYYLRAGRCHLARLAISPSHRGRALGVILVRELCQRGCSELQVTQCSLFVDPYNAPAIHLYNRLGFISLPYPEAAPQFDACTYMVASPDAISTWNAIAQAERS
jgi:ribosomal protein S18 acetylase RimI-like enzyme